MFAKHHALPGGLEWEETWHHPTSCRGYILSHSKDGGQHRVHHQDSLLRDLHGENPGSARS